MNKISDLTQEIQTPGPSGQNRTVRAFSLWEMTEYLLPVSLSHLRRLLRTIDGLPKGHAKSEGATREFTAEDLRQIKDHLGPLEMRASICLGIVGRDPERTAQIASLLAVRAALAGLNVTAFDLGPGGRMTERCCGYCPPSRAAGEELLINSAIEAHRQINQRRASLGEPPLALPVGLSSDETNDPVPRPSRWPGLSVLPGGSTMGHALDWGHWQRLIPQWTGRDAFAKLAAPMGGLLICDLGSDPSPLMLAGLDRSDLLLVVDDGLSANWFNALCERIGLQEEAESERAKAVGTTSAPFTWQALRRVPVAHASPFGSASLPPLAETALPSELTVWDIVPRSMPRATYVQLRTGPEAFWKATFDLLQKTGTA